MLTSAIVSVISQMAAIAGFVAVVVEWSVGRHTAKLQAHMRERETFVDQRLDVVECGVTEINATVKTELKYLEKAIDELNKCEAKLSLLNRGIPPFN